MLSAPLLAIDPANIVLNPTTDVNFWPRFLLQLLIVLVLCKLLGVLLSYLRQVQVIGEIVAGIVVGPTVLGRWQWWSTHIFPSAAVSASSANCIALCADVGIVLFMFHVGLDLNEALVRKQWRRAIPVAAAAIAFPFLLGIGLGAWLFDANNSELPVPVGRTAFYLFIGSSMSFTALPVLASLLSATGLLATPIGVQTIASATLDDVLAWCMLAISSAFAKGDANAGAVTVALSAAYIAFMLAVVRPLLARLHRHYRARNAEDSHTFLFAMLLVLLASALFCEVIQIHSFFGAFIAGLAAPKAGFWHIDTANRIELVTRQLLLPLFFVSSGSRTNIASITSATFVGAVFVVWLVATAGKLLPSALVTKLVSGRSWRYAATVGVLMNTRGLVELIALNVGYSLGILSQQLFSVLVLMALLTTFCTSPLVHLLWIRSAEGRTEMAESAVASAEYAAEVNFQRTVSHLSLGEQDARLAEFRAERETRKEQQQNGHADGGRWSMSGSGLAGSLVSPDGAAASSGFHAPQSLPPLSDEQQRVEQRYTVHAMGSVSDLDMERAGDTQQVVFHAPAVQRELSRQRSSRRGSLELESAVARLGPAGVHAEDSGTPKRFVQSGGSILRSAGGRTDLSASQGRALHSGSYRLDLQRQAVADGQAEGDADTDASHGTPLHRSGPAGDGLVHRSGSTRSVRAASPRGAAAAAPPAEASGLQHSSSGAVTRSAGGRTTRRTPHPADQEN